MNTRSTNRILIIGLCGIFAMLGFIAAQLMPTADAQATPTASFAGVAAGALGQVQGGHGGYAVVPIMQTGGPTAVMRYVMAIAPDGKVSIIHTNPTNQEVFGTIFKQLSLK